MRHRKSGRKLNRNSSHRRAMFRNMITSLFQHERIVTTLPKAKDLRPIAERLITQGKKGTLHARRKLLSYIQIKEVAHKVMDEIAPRFADRDGGYIRILKLGYRDGDKAEMAIVELIGADESKSTTREKPAPAEKPKKEATPVIEVEPESAREETEEGEIPETDLPDDTEEAATAEAEDLKEEKE